jgi:hypothetical protein
MTVSERFSVVKEQVAAQGEGSGIGIYFKVFDPQFFQDHQGQSLRFSQNGTEFTDTGLKLESG